MTSVSMARGNAGGTRGEGEEPPAAQDKSETELEEPEEGNKMKVGPEEITTEEEWCSEQLYQLLVQKTEGPALAIVRNLNTHGKARGLSAWYRTMREAERGAGRDEEARDHRESVLLWP